MLEAIDGNKKEPEIDIGLYTDFSSVARAIEAVGVRPNRLAVANDIEREQPSSGTPAADAAPVRPSAKKRAAQKTRIFPLKFTVCPK